MAEVDESCDNDEWKRVMMRGRGNKETIAPLKGGKTLRREGGGTKKSMRRRRETAGPW